MYNHFMSMRIFTLNNEDSGYDLHLDLLSTSSNRMFQMLEKKGTVGNSHHLRPFYLMMIKNFNYPTSPRCRQLLVDVNDARVFCMSIPR